MIKTLRITTFIAAILAVGVLAFPVVYGDWGDEEIEKFLKAPGAIERFKKAKGAKVKTGSQVSPLVTQAVLFAGIINPRRPDPVPPKPRTPREAREEPRVTIAPPKQSVKFDLIGTSYYASRPELSLAYINEPGKGLYWVRQGASVGHLLIEEVKDGSIIVKDRETTVTLAPKRAPKKSLIKGETTSTSTTTLPGFSASITSTSSVPVAAGAGQSTVSVEKTTVIPTVVNAPVNRRALPRASNSEQDADALLASFLNKLRAEQDSKDGSSETERAALKEAIADFEAMRVPADEAKRLDRLGKELKQVRRSPVSGGGSKVGKSGSPQPPPRPAQSSTGPPRTPTRRPPTRRPPTRRPPTRPPSQPPK